MADKNNSVSDILKQVRDEQNEILAGLSELSNSELLANLELEENPLVREILNDVAKQSTEIALTLDEINEQING